MLDLLMFPLRILLFKLSWLAEKSKLYADCVSYLKTVPFELSFQSTQLQHNIYMSEKATDDTSTVPNQVTPAVWAHPAEVSDITEIGIWFIYFHSYEYS